MDFDKLNVDRKSGSRGNSDDAALLIGRAAVKAISNSPLMANMRELSVRMAKSMESSLGRSALHAHQGILQITSGVNNQLASFVKRLLESVPPSNEVVFAAYEASKALSEGDTRPMDRYLIDHLKLPATPANRRLLRNIIDSSLARDIREVRDQWLVLGPKQAKALISQVNSKVRLSGSHKAALLAYGTSSDSGEEYQERKAEELPTAVFFAWSDIQQPGHSSTLVDV